MVHKSRDQIYSRFGKVTIVVIAQCVNALFHSICDLKATQINVQHQLVQELMPCKLKLSHSATEVNKSICCLKGKCAVDLSTVSRRVKTFSLSCMNLNGQACFISHRGKSGSSTERVSGKLGISLPRLVPYLPNLGKNSWSDQCVSHQNIAKLVTRVNHKNCEHDSSGVCSFVAYLRDYSMMLQFRSLATRSRGLSLMHDYILWL